MSVYDFNHNNEHHHSPHHLQQYHPNHQLNSNLSTNLLHNSSSSHLSTSATLASQSVADRCHMTPDSSDYLSRGFTSVSHHHNLDMSVQLTRPTSKTALLVRQKRAMLEQLSCYLCKGYLIDATTIDECMDSFCKSCIINYLRNHNNCPKCGTLIHKTNPLSTIHSDKVLQDIVYKLIPGLYDDEMRRRREFYRKMFGGSVDEDDEDDDSSCSFAMKGSLLSSEQYGVISHPKPFYKPTDNIDLSIEPQTRGDSSNIYYDNKRQSIVTCFTGSLPHQPLSSNTTFSSVDSQQFKTYLRCPAKLTTLQLKKFVAAKFNICCDDTIHLLYLNESLKDEYSLIDIAYIYDWRGIEHMRLFYIIERDLGKSASNDHQPESQSRKAKHRQSIGTSTQTVKRVCIDPQPRFYEVQNDDNNNTNQSSHPSGRSMRPRNDTYSSKIASSSQTTQAPILRSYSSTKVGASDSGISLNGVAGRELAIVGSGAQQRQQPLPNLSMANAIKDVPKMRQEVSKEVRSLRKQYTASPQANNPRVSSNANSTNRPQESGDKIYSAYIRTRYDNEKRTDKDLVPVKQNNINSINRQLVPYVRKGYSTVATTVSTPNQSSLVTLASFTRPQSNHVLSTSSSSTATVSGSNSNMIGDRVPSKTDVRQLGNVTRTPPSQNLPQVISFVTERGIIVRRVNSQDETASAATSSNSSANTIKNALPAPSANFSEQSNSSQSQTNRSIPINQQFSTSSNNQRSSAGTSRPQHSSLNATGHDGSGASARHHPKVKPVYKTFVDPTKLKSPNFKKLGYTARH